MDKKIFIFDIDGTLVDTKTHIIPTSCIEALKKLKKHHLIVISTGRSIHSLTSGGFDSIADWDYFICNNGQAIYDHDKNCMHLECIPEATIRKSIDIANTLHAPLHLIGNKQLLTSPPNDHVFLSHEFFKEAIPQVGTYDGFDVIMMIAYGPMGFDYAPYQEIEGIRAIPGQSTYADIVIDGYSKYEGIQYLLQHIHMHEYIAFGDSLNDYEMIQHAKVGIVLGDGNEDLKKIADHVTTNVLDDGIEKALQYFHWI